MPIFTSRFSAERSLVGTFLSTRPQQDAEETSSRGNNRRAERVSNRPAQPQDRLELSDRQTTLPSQNSTRSTRTGQAPEARLPAVQTDRQPASTETATVERPGAQSAADPPLAQASLQITEPFTQVESRFHILQENQDANQSTVPGRLEGLLERLEGLGTSDRPLQAIHRENQTASQNATPTRLEAFLEREEPLNMAAVPEEDTLLTAALATELAVTEVMAAEEPNTPLREREAQALAVEPPPREEQEEELRRDLQTITSGLNADAAQQSRRNVEQTVRNNARVAEQQIRSDLQDNRAEIRSLQTNRRQLQQESQRTDHAIRQLQNQNARIQNSGTTSSGSSLDILVQ